MSDRIAAAPALWFVLAGALACQAGSGDASSGASSESGDATAPPVTDDGGDPTPTIASGVTDGTTGDTTSEATETGETGESGESGGACEAPEPPGPGVDACTNPDNPAGPVLDLAWPAAMNVGHDAGEGQTVHFHWEDAHNVLQVATFLGQEEPLGPFASADWPGQVASGPAVANGAFDWDLGAYPCGYRPGVYFFVDEDNPNAGITSVTLTVDEFNNDHYVPRPCAELADPAFHGGRYVDYAGRTECTVFEVNNFQTVAHFDWVPATFGARQGDLILFRWTGSHNVVQVHDVDEDLGREEWASPAGSHTSTSGPRARTCRGTRRPRTARCSTSTRACRTTRRRRARDGVGRLAV